MYYDVLKETEKQKSKVYLKLEPTFLEIKLMQILACKSSRDIAMRFKINLYVPGNSSRLY